jgi:hypothetical protein
MWEWPGRATVENRKHLSLSREEPTRNQSSPELRRGAPACSQVIIRNRESPTDSKQHLRLPCCMRFVPERTYRSPRFRSAARTPPFRRTRAQRGSTLSVMPLVRGMRGWRHPRWDELEDGSQLGKLQQLADEIAGSSQLDRTLTRLRRQGNRYECSEASGGSRLDGFGSPKNREARNPFG